MDMRIREWSKLQYLDPMTLLPGLRKIYDRHSAEALATVPYSVLSLRRRDLQTYKEGRQAALFCCGFSRVVGVPVKFAMAEASDYDVVIHYFKDETHFFAPVQLKELVPPYVNRRADFQTELDKVAKYGDSKGDLVVVFHLNRTQRIEFGSLRYPRNIASLWFLGASDDTQDRWALIGDMLQGSPELQFVYGFDYPSFVTVDDES